MLRRDKGRMFAIPGQPPDENDTHSRRVWFMTPECDDPFWWDLPHVFELQCMMGLHDGQTQGFHSPTQRV